MANLLREGFEGGTLGRMSAVPGDSAVSSSYARSGAYGGAATGSAGGELGSIYFSWATGVLEVYFRCPFRYDALASGYTHLVYIRKSDSTTLVEIRMDNTANRFQALVGGAVVSTGIAVYVPGIYTVLEGNVKIDPIIGKITTKVNGGVDIDFIGDTDPGTGSLINQYALGVSSISPRLVQYDDIALNDTTGTSDNSWIGESYIIAAKPISSGTYTQFPSMYPAGSSENLVAINSGTELITIYSGISNTAATYFAAPDINGAGLSLDISGNLISSDDGTGKIYVHLKTTGKITNSFSSPGGSPTGLTVGSSGNLISNSQGLGVVYVHSGITATITSSFTLAETALTGLSMDNSGNLLSTGFTTDKIYVHVGVSATISSFFASPGSEPRGLTVTSAGNLISFEPNGTTLYIHSGITGAITSSLIFGTTGTRDITLMGAFSHWLMVQETPHRGDDNYIYGDDASIGLKDTFGVEAVSSIIGGQTIRRVNLRIVARQDQAGVAAVAPYLITPTAVGYEGTQQSLIGTYTLSEWEYPTNLDTGAAWTATQINSIQIGAVIR